MSDKVVELEPVDLTRCQADYKEPHQPFRLGFAPPHWKRCENKPTVVATEAKVQLGVRGSMSMCDNCLQEAVKRLGRKYFTYKEIKE